MRVTWRRREGTRNHEGFPQWLDLALVILLVGSLAAINVGDDVVLAADASLYLTLLLPVVAYVMLRLARRGVEKDIALVRSMDRLR